MPPGSATLLDLLPDVLLRIAAHLPQHDRLRLPEVCSRLANLLSGPGEAWRSVEAALVLGEQEEWPPGLSASAAAQSQLQCFFRWLGPRLPGVEELRIAVDASRQPQGMTVSLPGDLLICYKGPHPPMPLSSDRPTLPLMKLSIQWAGPGPTWLCCHSAVRSPKLPHLRKLSFPAGTRLCVAEPSEHGHNVPNELPNLTDFGIIDGLLQGSLDSPWLPPSVTMLALASVGLNSLPGVLAHLPHLKSMVLDHNYFLNGSSLAPLSHLSSLQELNLSECALAAFPRQISTLSRLRILYLHNAFSDAADLAPAEWTALCPLRHLIFLSISGNSLHHLPPAVEGLTQLQGLHMEDNMITSLPAGAPVLAGLRELLLDWRTALGSPTALAAATRLTRLVLNDHLALELGPGAHLGAVDTLLGTLGALSALRRVEDVIPESLQGMVSSISAPVAHALLRLGRACPNVELGTMPATNAGWTLSSLVAGLPHNDGLALLQAATEGGEGSQEDKEGVGPWERQQA